MLRYLLLVIFSLTFVDAHYKSLYIFGNRTDPRIDLTCKNIVSVQTVTTASSESEYKLRVNQAKRPMILYHSSTPEPDPYEFNQDKMHEIVFGPSIHETTTPLGKYKIPKEDEETDELVMELPMGDVMRGELFNNKSSVHLPSPESIHRGHCRLKITNDFIQTALNAFAILTLGSIEDIKALPADYVLHSARTIAMLKLAREKLAMLWTVVKDGRRTIEVSHELLEMYRPLFKYVNAREMARLNLSDDRIVAFIGTHAELDRHQMGVVASTYINVNSKWTQPRYLNIMNNLLCGIPMNFMRRLPSDVYLQFTHQVFYHIRACDPLQRRFYLGMMTRTSALGKSYSWSARDVSRLGLLLAEVDGPDLAAINPEAMSGITAQVMLEIPAHNLQYLTEMQLRYLGLKPLNILARQLKAYQDQLRSSDNAFKHQVHCIMKYLLIQFLVLCLVSQ